MSDTMTIPRLAREVAERTGCSMVTSELVIKGLVDSIAHHLRERRARVYLNGLGVFEMRTVRPKRIRIFGQDKVQVTAASLRAHFSPATILKGIPLDNWRAELDEPRPSVMDECPV